MVRTVQSIKKLCPFPPLLYAMYDDVDIDDDNDERGRRPTKKLLYDRNSVIP